MLPFLPPWTLEFNVESHLPVATGLSGEIGSPHLSAMKEAQDCHAQERAAQWERQGEHLARRLH